MPSLVVGPFSQVLMHPSTRETIGKKLNRLRAGLHHAFAAHTDPPPLSSEDAALLDRVADAIVARRMAAPAVVFLESLGPMNFLGSQALHFFTPIIDLAFQAREVRHVARLLERRDTVTRLIALIEARSAR
jgi:hypothetical protein